MSFSASQFNLQDVMLLLGAEGWTGELIVESGNNIGSLLFHEGRIMLAFSPYTRAIGDLLVEQGALTDGELLDVLKQQRSGTHVPVGTLLLKTGKVNFATIEKMVHAQIRKSVEDFASWKDADFSFARKMVRPFDEIHLPVFEFIPADLRRSLHAFVAELSKSGDVPATPASPPAVEIG